MNERNSKASPATSTPARTSTSAPRTDPREEAEFNPRYYPRANGQPAPPPGSECKNDRIILRFLAAYYRINLEATRHRELLTQQGIHAGAPAEREVLQAIERALCHRDALEDEFAPFGVIAEPVLQEGVTVDVRFRFASVNAEGRRRSEDFTITACVPVPLPPGIKLEDLPVQIEGPGFHAR